MTMYRQGESTIDPEQWKNLPQGGQIQVIDPVAEALNCLAANIGALALAIDAYTQLRKKETPDNG